MRHVFFVNIKQSLVFIVGSLFFFHTNFCYSQKTEIVSGSGFFISQNGYLATNYHVIEGALDIEINLRVNNVAKSFKAEVVKVDEENDLAVLKPKDPAFRLSSTLPYTFRMMDIKVGEKCFAMGYPSYQTLGNEVKVTDGLINSKTGFQNDNKSYQISAPIQPGSSGGPLFDGSGNVIGITSSGIPSMDNVGYALKIASLVNLTDAIPNFSGSPTVNTLSKLDLPGKVKVLSNFVVLVKVTVPACDEVKMNEDFKKIKWNMTPSDISRIIGIEGDNYRNDTHNFYKWEYCGDISRRIEMWYQDGKATMLWKTFNDKSCSPNITVDRFKQIKIDQTKEEVAQLLGIAGDVYRVEFQERQELVKYHSCESKPKWIEVWFRNGRAFHIAKYFF